MKGLARHWRAAVVKSIRASEQVDVLPLAELESKSAGRPDDVGQRTAAQRGKQDVEFTDGAGRRW